MFIIAASLYLPEHVAFMAHRMFYYFSGDSSHFTSAAAAQKELGEVATQFLGGAEAGREL